MEELNYGNWIRTRVLFILGLSALIMGFLAALPIPLALRILAGAFCIVLFLSALLPLYLFYVFSHQGGNLQENFYDLLIDKLGGSVKGNAIDIGTGNGILAIKLALANHDLDVVGVDYWGKDWDYSMSVCEENSRKAELTERVHFMKGNAASLDFANATFDAVVSNLTFHEVKLVKRKSDVIKEALRVLKPGGSFAFIDYFYDSQYYGESSEFEILLWSLKLLKVELKPLHEVLPFPKLLKHPRALGKVGIICGKK